uniref:FIST C-domain domain-containing protein n=1 Tax=Helicotheca tamesis TaxID=374047 RepID=A0A7S2N2P5_9STRA|mmetsp:Transcript_8302/g.11425  ORF Transcript_8302/g.11425 Transcript_8302/m.11425 type:complete len:619 (+) Transcript_8302:176-2032(+)
MVIIIVDLIAMVETAATATHHHYHLSNSNSDNYVIPPKKSFLNSNPSTANNDKDDSSSKKKKPFWRTAVARNRNPSIAIEELFQVASKHHNKQSSSSQGNDKQKNDYLSSLSSSQEDGGRSLALLFVGPSHASSFPDIVKQASEQLNEISSSATFVAVVGAGVIGGGEEVDTAPPPPSTSTEKAKEEEEDSYAMSLLYGIIPSTAAATGFCVTNASGPNPSMGGNNMAKAPSYLIFADPWSPLDDILSNLQKGDDSSDDDDDKQSPIIAGGISCPPLTAQGTVAPNCESTVALDGLPLPRGSAVGICLTGSLGLQTIVAQGCRGVGPSYTVTSVASTEPAAGNKGEDGMGKVTKGNVVMRLDDEPALHRLAEVTEQASDADKALLRSGWLLCGLSDESSSSSSVSDEEAIQSPRDFLIRQVMGLVPDAKAIVIGSREISLGDTFRFFVRDANTAKEDLNLMVRRAKTERLFNMGDSSGVPLAALQVSCVARGRSLYGRSNVDLEMIEELVEGAVMEDDDEDEEDVPPPPVAGFFANGEIGPVGLSGFGSSSPLSSSSSGTSSSGTHVHGFTAVTAVLCDFSSEQKSDGKATVGSSKSLISESTIISTFENDLGDDAWG